MLTQHTAHTLELLKRHAICAQCKQVSANIAGQTTLLECALRLVPQHVCVCVLWTHLQDFVLAVHNRAAAAGAAGGMTKRAEIMLELVMDIKNNRQRDVKASRAAAAAVTAAGGKKAAAAAAGAAAGRGGAAAVLQPGLLKWLKQSGIDEVTLANISWAKLIQPNKKGSSRSDLSC